MEAVEAIFDDIYNIVARQGFYTVLDLKKNNLTVAKESPHSSTNNHDRNKSAAVPSSGIINFRAGSNLRNVLVTTATVNKSHFSSSIPKRQTNEDTSKEICSFRAASSRGTTHDEHINKGVRRSVDADTELHQLTSQEVVIDLVPSQRGKKSASHSSHRSKETCITVTELKSVNGTESIPDKSDGKGVLWKSDDADYENRTVASLRKKNTVTGEKITVAGNGVGQRSYEQKLVKCIASNELVPSSRGRKVATNAVHIAFRASAVTVAPPREQDGAGTSAAPARQKITSGKSDKDVIVTSEEEVGVETSDVHISHVSSPKLIPSVMRVQEMGHDTCRTLPGRGGRRLALNRRGQTERREKCLENVGPVTLKVNYTDSDKSTPVSDVPREVVELSQQQTKLNSSQVTMVTGILSPKVMQVLKTDLVANMTKNCAQAPEVGQNGVSTRLRSWKGHNLLNAPKTDLQDASKKKRNRCLPEQMDINPKARTKGPIEIDSSERLKSRHILLKRLSGFKDSEVTNVACNSSLGGSMCTTSQDSNSGVAGSADKSITPMRRSYRSTKPVFRQYKYFPCFAEKKKCDKKKKPEPKGKNVETKSKSLAVKKNCKQKLNVKDSKAKSKSLAVEKNCKQKLKVKHSETSSCSPKGKNCKKRKIAKVSGVNDVLARNRKSMKQDVFTDEILNKQHQILAEHTEIAETVVEDGNIMSALCQLESKGKSLQLHDINLLMPMTTSFQSNQKQAGRLHGNGSENHPGGVWRRLIPEN